MRYLIGVGLLIAALLSGCGSVDVADYSTKAPKLDLERFFSGELTAHGILKNRSGEVIRHFNASIIGSWQEGVGTLDESFVFDDGEEQKRVWTLTPVAENQYRATAGDVVGPGVAEAAGNALFLKYVLRIPYGDGTIDVSIDDRMYLVDEKTIINESTMYKFGFRVGEIVLTIVKS